METCNIVLTFESVVEILYQMTIQMKRLWQYFRTVFSYFSILQTETSDYSSILILGTLGSGGITSLLGRR